MQKFVLGTGMQRYPVSLASSPHSGAHAKKELLARNKILLCNNLLQILTQHIRNINKQMTSQKNINFAIRHFQKKNKNNH